MNIGSNIAGNEATERGWLGDVDGLKVSLDAANQKLALMRKIRTRTRSVDLPIPAVRSSRSL